MSPSIEQRLAALENQEKVNKATFPIAGSLVKLVVTKSRSFSLQIPAASSATIKVKFTPSKNLGQNNFINLTAESTGTKYPCQYYTSPQTGDGTATITAVVEGSFLETLTANIIITASGTVTGSFTIVE